tara:strand:- start:27 stop:356 length:330 start_codon:yes stop_codon:yes gene_type:complete
MRYPKFLINAFATLGVFAFIFLACSVSADNSADEEVVIIIDEEEDEDENPPPIENNYGKYQISTITKNDDYLVYTTILNTETGDVKIYRYSESEGGIYELLKQENLGGF